MAAQTTLSAFSPATSSSSPTVRSSHGTSSTQECLESDVLASLGELTSCLMDVQGRALTFGANWKAMTGLESEQCTEEKFVDSFHPQHRPLFFKKIAELQKNASAPCVRFRAQYGSTHVGYRWYEFTLAPRLTADSVPVLAVVMRHIGREMETERVLRTAQIEAELAMQARAEFLGHMSHELRTPLNAVLGFAEMMELGIHGEIEDPRYKDYLCNIRESGHMLLNRINDMLEVASIEVGDNVLHDALASPEEIIEAAQKLHRHEAFCKRITLQVVGSLPRVLARCDVARLTRALGNIVSNAIRFSAPGGEIRLACEYTSGGKLAFTVSDDGEGISADHLGQLQEALEKRYGVFASNPETVTLGLGLAVAREFACLHGGRLEIDSRKQHGTQVTLTLPVERITSLDPPRRKLRAKAAEKNHA